MKSGPDTEPTLVPAGVKALRKSPTGFWLGSVKYDRSGLGAFLICVWHHHTSTIMSVQQLKPHVHKDTCVLCILLSCESHGSGFGCHQRSLSCGHHHRSSHAGDTDWLDALSGWPQQHHPA